MDVEKTNMILQTYREQTENVREALRLAGMPASLINKELINIPNYTEMLPEDILLFYQETKESVILYLNRLGFSQREIGLRLGGHTYNQVNNVLKKHKKAGDIL